MAQPTETVTDILMQLLDTRSVAGHTDEAMRSVRGRFEDMGLRTQSGVKGTLLATLDGQESEGMIFSAHLDTLGGMVSGITAEGRLDLETIGGYTMSSIEGEYCMVETWDGRLYQGTVLFDFTSVHAHGREKASERREKDKMHVRLDEEVSSRKDVEALGISVGDYIHFDPRPVRTGSGFIKSRHLDDKAGVAVLLEAARRLALDGARPRRTVHFLITCFEEVGHGAAGLIPPGTVEFIAVDMGVAGKGRESAEDRVTICAADSSGPFSRSLTVRLMETARKSGIPFVVDTYPHYGSDAAAALRSGMDARHGLIGPGVDASHAMERTHEKALEATVELIRAYAMS
jgi:putative aminopeptidase FrvX